MFTDQGIGIEVLYASNHTSTMDPFYVFTHKPISNNKTVKPLDLTNVTDDTTGLWYHTRDRTLHYDPVNTKLQFLYETINNERETLFRQSYTAICQNTQRSLNIDWQLLRISPTMAARAYLGRDDIYAVYKGEALQIWACKQADIKTIHWNYKIKTQCYDRLPVQLNNGDLLFAIAGTSDLSTEAEEIDCNHKIQSIYFDTTRKTWMDSDSHNPTHVSNYV